jgi:hypothetical protein
VKRSFFPLLAVIGLTTSQSNDDLSVNNTLVPLFSCESIICLPENSICSTSSSDGKPVGIGIASGAVITSSTNLSYSLINGLDNPGFTGIGSSQYEYTDAQLFVGVDPASDFPSGCVLMMQYNAQTFPLENMPDNDTRPEELDKTRLARELLMRFARPNLRRRSATSIPAAAKTVQALGRINARN